MARGPSAKFHELSAEDPIGDATHHSHAATVRGQIQRVRLDLLARENERLDQQIQQLLEQQKEQQLDDRQWREGWQSNLVELSRRVDQLISQAEAAQDAQTGEQKAGPEIRDTVKPLLLAVLEMLDDPAAGGSNDAAAVAKALAAIQSTPAAAAPAPPGPSTSKSGAAVPGPAGQAAPAPAPPAVTQPRPVGPGAAVAPPRPAAPSAPKAEAAAPWPAGPASATMLPPSAPKPQPASPAPRLTAPQGRSGTQQPSPSPAPAGIAPESDVILGKPTAPHGGAETSAAPARPAAPAPRPAVPGVAAAALGTDRSAAGDDPEPLVGKNKASLEGEVEIEIARLLLPQDSADDSAGLSLEPKEPVEARATPETRVAPQAAPAVDPGTAPSTRPAPQAQAAPPARPLPKRPTAFGAQEARQAQPVQRAPARPEAAEIGAKPDSGVEQEPVRSHPEPLELGTAQTPKVMPPETPSYQPKPTVPRQETSQSGAVAADGPAAEAPKPPARTPAAGLELHRKAMEARLRQKTIPEPEAAAPKTMDETADSGALGSEPTARPAESTPPPNPTAAMENEPLPKCLTERWNDQDDDNVLAAARGQAGLPRDKGALRWPFRRLRSTIDRDHAWAERDPESPQRPDRADGGTIKRSEDSE